MARAFDFGLWNFGGDGIPLEFSPREYNGIDLYESGNTARVWVAYSGALIEAGIPDDFGHRTLIFGQQITIQESP
jgi:hypothetical protein